MILRQESNIRKGSDILKQCRKVLGWTQAKLSTLSGVDALLISLLERDYKQIGTHTAEFILICKTLQPEIKHLFRSIDKYFEEVIERG